MLENLDKPLPADPIDLVAIDLDGTLLRSDGKICPTSVKAIATARKVGVKVVLASGRAPRRIQRFQRMLGLDTLQIGHDGALVYDGDPERAIHHQPLSSLVARRVVDLALSVAPSILIGLEIVDMCYTNSADNRIRAQSAAGPEARHSASLDPHLSGPVTKILLVGKTAALGGVHAALAGDLGDQVAFTFSDMNLLQIVHATVDKRTALQRVAKHYDVPRGGVMAIGDAPNDVGMLTWAGLGVVMQNSWPDVRAAAQFVVPSNDEGGVAHAFEKYVLRR